MDPLDEALVGINASSSYEPPRLPDYMVESHWYAIYTCANHEKRVAAECLRRGVDHFMPLYSSVRRWRDRRVNLELPLFPSYVFAHLALRDRLSVLQIPGVVRFLGFAGRPAALPDEEMRILRDGLSQRLNAEPHPFLTIGRRVRIVRGLFAGLEGFLKQKKGRSRVVVSLELIQQSISLEVDVTDIQPVLQSAEKCGSSSY
jgi:transcription antitermination factor NusG